MDKLGLLLVVVVTVASADDGTIAPEVLGRLTAEHRTRLKKHLGRQEVPQSPPGRLADEGPKAGYVIEVVSRPPGAKGFVKLPQAVGGGADVRLAGSIPAAQPGLRAVHASRARR